MAFLIDGSNTYVPKPEPKPEPNPTPNPQPPATPTATPTATPSPTPTPEPAPTPTATPTAETTPPTPTTQPTVSEDKPEIIDGWMARYLPSFEANQLRNQVESDFEETQRQAEIDKQATEAAEQVQNSYDSPPNGTSAHEAASQTLVEVTTDQPPEVVAAIVEQSQPTINRISADLNEIAEDEDGKHNDYKENFDDTINNLAVVSERAIAAPNGQEAVATIASSLVKHIDPDEIGRFDEALGRTIQNGSGAELTAEVVKQLQSAGRTGQADDILENVEDSINNVRGDLKNAVDDAAKYNEELGWLIAQWQPMMTEEQLTDAIEAYKAENPEYTDALEKIDDASVNALRALTAFQDAETRFDGLGHADNVQGALEKLFGDGKAQFGIAQSQAATEELGNLLDRTETNPAANNVLDGIIGIAGTVDDGDFLTSEIANKVFDVMIGRTLNAATATTYDALGNLRVDDFARVAGTTEQLDRLQRYADKLGYSSDQLDKVFNQLDSVARSTTEGQARARLRRLSTEVNILRQDNPEMFGNNNRVFSKIENLGLFLGAVGAASSIKGAIDETTAFNVANALVDTLDVGVAGLDKTLQTRIAANFIQKRPWAANLPLGTIGKGLGGIGLVLDTISIANDIRNGNYVEAGFSGVGAAGGALAVFGTTAAATGIGLVLIGGALIGSWIYGNIKEANKHETDGARAFLEGAGINPELANQLINNDNKGRSAAPVFTEVANRLGVDPKEMFEYLLTLSKDEAKRLVTTAHGVDPNDEGVFPENLDDPYWSDGLNDVNDLIEWMRENGYEDAPGL